MHVENELAIGIDIGGTKIAAGLVDAEGRVVEEVRRATPGHDARAVERTVAALVAELGAQAPGAAVGVGAAGWMDLSGSTVLFSPHLAWRNEPLRARLEEMVGRRVLLCNDADAAGWAEYRYGAAAGESHAVVLTLGTGIGGAMVTDGVLQRGRFGVAGEFGHQTLVHEGHRCACGNRGCWEQYASGNALGREGRGLLAAGSPVAHALRDAAGGNADAVTGELVTRLAASGDAACRDLLVDAGHWLGIGIANLAAVLDPGIVVIGGGLGSAAPLLIDTAADTYRRTLSGRSYRPFARVVRAALGPAAGLIGAADLARRAPAED
ncbi:ROK family glucokinase [Paeniglutamicibacter cryotolerans]|nr:ROK family protein [Paeniglutamicibacter cryotolerans]